MKKLKKQNIDLDNISIFDYKEYIDDIINILIYFKLPINYIDDISYKLENLKDNRKKYIFVNKNRQIGRIQEEKGGALWPSPNYIPNFSPPAISPRPSRRW